jgi:capsular polysaccharide biosynthesis protein
MRANQAEVAVLSDGQIVGSDGLVMTADRLVARESAWDDEKLRASGVLSGRLARPQIVGGAAASLLSQWCSAYYHWMTDALPRLRVLELVGEAETPLVLPAELSSWQRRSLELLGIDEQRCYRYRTEALCAERLVWPRPAAVAGHIPAWACEWLRTRLAPSAVDKTRKLYVTRRRERQRRVANEAELWACLAGHGFEIIDPGTLALDEQIVAFSEAAIVVGPHGGGLTNVLFGHGGAVVELFEPTYVNPCFYALASRSNHAYWHIVGQTGSGGDIVVDLHLVEATLAQLDSC